MVPVPRARYQIGLALTQDRLAVLAEAECFALAQAHQLVIARLLGEGARPVVVVIVRREDGAVLERLVVAAGGEV